ncbi:hypothetical protein VP01_1207g1 [Puccinia sorghi]|uniref:Uncharacterized protein n=1 Tax=Puccinia sorghi TaxID=27349 RepID=A0A0L6VQE0_9BASI|nr:hypothetical protein VP01_1207g1 [Puccinia sorghi]
MMRNQEKGEGYAMGKRILNLITVRVMRIGSQGACEGQIINFWRAAQRESAMEERRAEFKLTSGQQQRWLDCLLVKLEAFREQIHSQSHGVYNHAVRRPAAFFRMRMITRWQGCSRRGSGHSGRAAASFIDPFNQLRKSTSVIRYDRLTGPHWGNLLTERKKIIQQTSQPTIKDTLFVSRMSMWVFWEQADRLGRLQLGLFRRLAIKYIDSHNAGSRTIYCVCNEAWTCCTFEIFSFAKLSKNHPHPNQTFQSIRFRFIAFPAVMAHSPSTSTPPPSDNPGRNGGNQSSAVTVPNQEGVLNILTKFKLFMATKSGKKTIWVLIGWLQSKCQQYRLDHSGLSRKGRS